MNRVVVYRAKRPPRGRCPGASILQHNRYDAVPPFPDLDIVVMAGTRTR
jgi:hypothetical protein